MEFGHSSTMTFPHKLADGLWVVGNYFFNLYVVSGEQAAALIEVGVSAVVDDVIRQLDSLKIRPSFLVMTHPHADHVTGLAGLKERYKDGLVVAGEGASEFLSHPRAAEAIGHEDLHMTEALKSFGINSGRPPVTEPPSLVNCLVARDGDEIDLGGATLRFLRAAGHAPGEIVVHVPEIEALMTSDSLGFRFPGRGVFPLFFTGYSDYMATLERLRGLNPALVGPAHQGPITGLDVPTAFEESIQAAAALRTRIRQDARDADEIAAELLREFYRDELRLYTEENILGCCRLVVKRAKD